FFMVDVWERMGVDPRAVLKVMQEHPAPQQADFQRLLFSKIVPNTKKLGLLDASDGWLRKRFEHLGVIEFEDWVDTSEEYANLDAFEADAKTAN
nr:ferritin-like domain-containing protein [Acidimicrobiales bacterium]